MTRAVNWLNTRLTKARTFSIHLLLSLIAFSSLLAMTILYWFPGDLFFVDGGWQELIPVAIVVLVLGPVLTLILYKPGNHNRLLDMSMVAAIQVAALGYGFYTSHQQRTVAVVYTDRGFNTLSAQDNMTADKQLLSLNQQPRPLPATPIRQVPLLLTPVPEIGGVEKVLEDALNGYPGPQERSDQYLPLAEHHDTMRPHALGLQQLADGGSQQEVERMLEKRSLKPEDVEFYKFQARFASGIAVFDPDVMQIVAFVPHRQQAMLAAQLKLPTRESD